MRILGITLVDNKRIEIAFTALYGVGRSRAQSILDQAKIEYGIKAKELSRNKKMPSEKSSNQ